ncbi:MAG: hypothetical protein ACR2PI_13990 [Hyphomicrobiaceae bacterium]
MQVTELYDLLNWIDKEIRKRQIQQKYQTLEGKLQANAQPNQPHQPVETEKEELKSALEAVNIHSLSSAQQTYLAKLKILDFLGQNGISVVEDILFRNVVDVATAANRLTEIVSHFHSALNQAQQIEDGLRGLVELPRQIDHNIVVRVTFANEAAIGNVVELKSWADAWHEIGRGIAMSKGGAPEDVRVIGASTGSIVLDLAVVWAFAKVITKIINDALCITEKTLQIKLKAEELRSMQLKNDAAVVALERQVNEERDAGIGAIIQDVVDGAVNEMNGEDRNALERAVTKLVDFLYKGGDVDLIMPPEPPPGEQDDMNGGDQQPAQEVRELRESVDSIRKVKQSILQITDQ